MAMSLAALEILEEAQFPPAQARALARIFEIESGGWRDVLATKADLAELALTTKAELAQHASVTKADLAALAAATKADLAEHASATQADLAALAAATKAELAQHASATKADLAVLAGDFAQLASSTKADLAELRQGVALDLSRVEGRLEVKIESVKSECVRWTFLAIIGQATLLAGVMYFLLQTVR